MKFQIYVKPGKKKGKKHELPKFREVKEEIFSFLLFGQKGKYEKKIKFQLENYWEDRQRFEVDTPVKLFPGVQVKFLVIGNYKENSLHLISAVSADISSGITSNITSAAGQKPQDFLFVCFNIYILWPGLS